jgi:hypothetical protein
MSKNRLVLLGLGVLLVVLILLNLFGHNIPLPLLVEQANNKILHLKMYSKNLNHSFQWEAQVKSNKLRGEHVAKMST